MSPLPWYADSGDAAGGRSPVVLLHAFPLSSVMWERLVPLLAPHVRVVCVDLPGLGRSGVPEGAPSMRTVAEAVLAVLDRLAIARATLVGISTGGYAALAVAALAPERVEGLVLGSTTPWLIEPDVPADRRETAREVERAASTAPVADSADAGLGVTAHAEQPELVDLLRAVIAASDPAGVAWIARAIASRQDTAAVLRDLDRPVLLVFGDEDTDTPAARGRAMRDLRGAAGRAATTELVVLPGTGHLTALEQPARVAALLLERLG